MKKLRVLFHPLLIFILAQLAWLSLLGLWIYWFVSNYIIFRQVGDKLAPQLAAKGTNIVALGLILFIAILAGMYLIFIRLHKQITLTRLYDNFIANVTHELKSPMASIQLSLETLKSRQVPQLKQNEFIELMIKDANRLKKLIDAILQLSALEQKKIAHDFKVVTAESLVQSLIAEASERFKLPPQAIELCGQAPCQCVVDRDAMAIVFDNFIDNAIKYSNSPLKLVVKMTCMQKDFALEFIDQGIGIAAKDQKNLFKKFQRIDNPDVPNIKGTGLGLFWIKEIIKYHGGRVTVFSQGKNKGTTFKIELPIYRVAKKRHVNKLLRLTNRRQVPIINKTGADNA